MLRSRAFTFALTALAIACSGQAMFGYGWNIDSLHAWGSDDAFITIRYAHNLADGLGPVWNAGERVEGYSSPLMLLLLAPVFWFTDDPFAALVVAYLIGIVAALAALAVFHGWVRRRGGVVAAGWAVALFAAYPPLWAVVSLGLETPLTLLSLLWLASEADAHDQEPSRSLLPLAALSAFSTVNRADGFVLPLVIAVVLLWRGRRGAAIATIVGTLSALAPLVAWRLWYYGWPLPNTVYAKMAGTLVQRIRLGLDYLLAVGLWSALLPHVGIVLAALAAAAKRILVGGWSRWTIPSLIGSLVAAYYVLVGGDLYYERFLLPVVPFAIFILVTAAPGPRSLAAAATLLMLIQLAPLAYDGRFEWRWVKFDGGEAIGRWLGATFPGQSLAVAMAGKLPAYSGLPSLDMLGLTEAYIGHKPVDDLSFPGHHKSDLEYVLARRPDVIVMFAAGAAARDLKYPGLTEARYRAEGYCLRAMGYIGRKPVDSPVVDFHLRPIEDATWRDLVERRWNVAIIERASCAGATADAGQ